MSVFDGFPDKAAINLWLAKHETEKTDPHRELAAYLYGVPEGVVGYTERNAAKMVLFRYLYGGEEWLYAPLLKGRPSEPKEPDPVIKPDEAQAILLEAEQFLLRPVSLAVDGDDYVIEHAEGELARTALTEEGRSDAQLIVTAINKLPELCQTIIEQAKELERSQRVCDEGAPKPMAPVPVGIPLDLNLSVYDPMSVTLCFHADNGAIERAMRLAMEGQVIDHLSPVHHTYRYHAAAWISKDVPASGHPRIFTEETARDSRFDLTALYVDIRPGEVRFRGFVSLRGTSRVGELSGKWFEWPIQR